jgi:hypothetical protein
MRESARDPSDPDAMLRMIAGFWLTQAIYVAAKLGIADLLGEGAQADSRACERDADPRVFALSRAPNARLGRHLC